MAVNSFFVIFVFLTVSVFSRECESRWTIGVNYGRVADDLPSPADAVDLIRSLKIGQVKLFDANPQVLSALANSGLRVVVGVTNQEISALSSYPLAAEEWVQNNVVAHFPSTQIRFIDVGNEILSDYDHKNTWYELVPAMKNLHKSLARHNLSRTIKVTTSVAMDVLNISYPPSAGSFRTDVALSVLKPMLHFLSHSHSSFFLNVYPYFAWADSPEHVPLDYALFGTQKVIVTDGEFKYTDMLSAQIDATIAAMEKLGYPHVKLTISETGWPSKGDANQLGANLFNAATYNRRLVRRLLAELPIGTPKRPGTFIPAHIFSLFNENQKPGPTTERNWGLLYQNGSSKYSIDLTGKPADEENLEYAAPASLHSFPALPQLPYSTSPTNASLPVLPTPLTGSGNSSSSPYSSTTPSTHPISSPSVESQIIPSFPAELPTKWCVGNASVGISRLQEALDYACGLGGADCRAIQRGEVCFMPNSVQAHASYAFNSYWQKMKREGGTCSFGGAAMLTQLDPSYENCTFQYQD
eukprot:c30163_g1_i1 orf=307-1884(+)